MAALKTLNLSRSVVTLPAYNGVEDSITFNPKVFSALPKPSLLTHGDINKLLKAILWDNSYPSFVKDEMARRNRSNEIVDAWRYETANRDDLYWITKYVRLNGKLAKHAALNPNLDYQCLHNLFSKFEPKEEFRAERKKHAKKLVASLNKDAFNDELMLWLLKYGKQYGFEEEARKRILDLLGLNENVPSSWITEILKKGDAVAEK